MNCLHPNVYEEEFPLHCDDCSNSFSALSWLRAKDAQIAAIEAAAKAITNHAVDHILEEGAGETVPIPRSLLAELAGALRGEA